MSKKTNSQTKFKLNLTKKQIKRILIVLVCFLMAATLIYEFGRIDMGIWGESNSMKQLRADPLAKKDLLGMVLIQSDEEPNQSFMDLQTPHVDHWFLPKNKSLEEARAEVIKYAEENGWTRKETNTDNDRYWSGTKFGGVSYDINLSVTIEDPDNKSHSAYHFSTKSVRVSLR